jgi:hypothetical protein
MVKVQYAYYVVCCGFSNTFSTHVKKITDKPILDKKDGVIKWADFFSYTVVLKILKKRCCVCLRRLGLLRLNAEFRKESPIFV